jgi:hypothetical protein
LFPTIGLVSPDYCANNTGNDVPPPSAPEHFAIVHVCGYAGNFRPPVKPGLGVKEQA